MQRKRKVKMLKNPRRGRHARLANTHAALCKHDRRQTRRLVSYHLSTSPLSAAHSFGIELAEHPTTMIQRQISSAIIQKSQLSIFRHKRRPRKINSDVLSKLFNIVESTSMEEEPNIAPSSKRREMTNSAAHNGGRGIAEGKTIGGNKIIRLKQTKKESEFQLFSSTTKMAQFVPPGDINAPFDDKHTYHIKVINSSTRRIGYGIKTTNMKRLGVDPPCGVLDPKKAVLLAVSCDAYGQDDNDRITIEWINTTDGAAKQFCREWFQGDDMVRRKNLHIEYNP